MNPSRYLDPQDALVFTLAAFALLAALDGARFAAGIAVGACVVGVALSIARVRVVR